jgi:hypothetical protein
LRARLLKTGYQTLSIPISFCKGSQERRFDRAPAVPTSCSDCPNQRRGEWVGQQGVRTILFIAGKGGILPKCMRGSGMLIFPGRSVTMLI